MHGTGLFIALSTLVGGGTVVLIEEVGLDPDRVWFEVERNRVAVLTIVGDVFARPLLAALDAAPDKYDLSSLRAITSSGVTFSPDAKAGLMHHLPGVTHHRLARLVGGDHDPLRVARRGRHRSRHASR